MSFMPSITYTKDDNTAKVELRDDVRGRLQVEYTF